MARSRRPQLPVLPLSSGTEVKVAEHNALVRALAQYMVDQQYANSNTAKMMVNGMITTMAEASPNEVFIYEGHLVVNVADKAFLAGLGMTASVGSVSITIT